MSENGKVPKKTLLGYELTAHQDAIINYLVPALSSYVLYVLLFASDLGVVYRHHRDENPVWGALTFFFIYLPVIGSYVVIVSSWELWPEPEGYGLDNVVWFCTKTSQHLFFPVWVIWRYAEKIFWSIEAARSTNDEEITESLAKATAPRNVELYLFLQAYLHSLPQILLQIHVLMKVVLATNKETADVQIVSLLCNLSKVAATTTFYQRFKSQKLVGKQYPWFKPHKYPHDPTIDEQIILRRDRPVIVPERNIVEQRPTSSNLEQIYDLEPSTVAQHRRSSDFYLEPTSSLVDDVFITEQPTSQAQIQDRPEHLRETSVVDGPKRPVFRQATSDEPDFNIRRLRYIKGLPEDDLAGKLVAFCWWFCFLLARILAISTFAYFYHAQVLWLVGSHFVIVVALLIYDAKTDEVKRAKAIFFVFIGLIYIFCIVEFKIKFKKTKLIYGGFFTLVYVENFIMCLIWWFRELDTFENDFWFRYVFIAIVMCSVISLTAMLFYLNVNKPKKVVVGAVAAS